MGFLGGFVLADFKTIINNSGLCPIILVPYIWLNLLRMALLNIVSFGTDVQLVKLPPPLQHLIAENRNTNLNPISYQRSLPMADGAILHAALSFSTVSRPHSCKHQDGIYSFG